MNPSDAPSGRAPLGGQVALVTGAATGIGRGIAERLAGDGADLVIVDVDGAGATKAADELQATGVNAVGAVGDVSVRRDVDRAVELTLTTFGRIDVLVNNAGVVPMSGLFDVTDEEWSRCLAINLTGAFLCTQIVSSAMVAKGVHGRIVNVASVESVVARRNQIAYGASKGGLLMLTKATALELAEHGITVNAVGPGAIDSGHGFWDDPERLTTALARIPLRRIGRPSDIAGAVAFLAGPDASFITGSIVYVDGGVLIE